MLLDLVHFAVVILLNEVIPWEGGLLKIVPQDEEVELELEAVAIDVLQVDGPLIVLAFIVLFDVSTNDASLCPFQQTFILMACSRKF